MRWWLIATAIAALLGGGVAVLASDLLGDDPQAQALVPADAVMVVHVTLDPSLSQKRALADLLTRLPPDAEQRIQESVVEALDAALGEVDLDFATDVEPWLGGEVAAFVTTGAAGEPDGAVVVEATDTQAALDATRRAVVAEVGEPTSAEHRERSYWVIPRTVSDEPETSFGVVGGFLVLGTSGGVRNAIDASLDGGIEGNAGYNQLVGSLAADRLLTFWVDTPELLGAVTAQLPPEEAAQLTDTAMVAQQQPSAGAVLATSDAVVVEAVSAKPAENPGLFQAAPTDAGLMASLPGDAWLSMVVPGIGPNLESVLDATPDAAGVERDFTRTTGMDLRDDVLSWMSDGALFVRGASFDALGGALVVQSTAAQATTAFLQRLVDSAAQEGVAVTPTRAGDLEGFELAGGAVPFRVTALGGDRLIIAVDSGQAGEDSVVAAVTGEGSVLEDSEVFARATAALGDGFAPIFFVDVQRVTRVVQSGFGESPAPSQLTQAEPYLERLSHVIAGTRDDGDLTVQRIVIGATPP